MSKPRDESLSIQIAHHQLDVIEKAATALNVSPSECILTVAVRNAQTVLRDRTTFTLDGDGFARFEALLAKPS